MPLSDSYCDEQNDKARELEVFESAFKTYFIFCVQILNDDDSPRRVSLAHFTIYTFLLWIYVIHAIESRYYYWLKVCQNAFSYLQVWHICVASFNCVSCENIDADWHRFSLSHKPRTHTRHTHDTHSWHRRTLTFTHELFFTFFFCSSCALTIRI